MRKLHAAAFAGIAAIAAVGATAACYAHGYDNRIDLPGGSTARAVYEGDVARLVMVDPAVRPLSAGFADDSDMAPSAMVDAVANALDTQAAELLASAAVLLAQPQLGNAELELGRGEGLPEGIVRYRLVSTATGNGVCRRDIAFSSAGPGRVPELVFDRSNGCGDSGNSTPGDALSAPASDITKVHRTALGARGSDPFANI